MADISDINAAQTVKIVGSDATGVEQTPVASTSNADLQVVDRANTSGVNGNITVGTSAVAARVGGSNLAVRKTLTITNLGTTIIYWGYSAGVTTANGTPIYKKQMTTWEGIGPAITVYLISASAGNNVRITESG
jgi:hypothetical protein